MSKVQWRPQLNALTTPQSYRAQPIPRDSLGYDAIAERIALRNPVINAGLAQSVMLTLREVIAEELINGNQISLENFATWHLSLAARLDAPDDPLPRPALTTPGVSKFTLEEKDTPDPLPEQARQLGDDGFIGRQQSVQQLERTRLRQPQAAFLIHGMAGVGKTTGTKTGRVDQGFW